ncbi:sialoadhesin-like [Polyodon spathula]|uniref:sialoadhesin-like n=1 Tax=Polyodon spathula TaxID=7913 RepID=UPI001B7E585B|nr:sialoadhesin-like [Polyodon spathula]
MLVKGMFFISMTALLVVPAVQELEFKVHYSCDQICALRGSSVVMPCSYYYPEHSGNTEVTIQTVKWFWLPDTGPISTDSSIYVYHSTESLVSPPFKHRTEYLGNKVRNCRLKMRDLQSSDTGRYYFRFETHPPQTKFTGTPGVDLSVTEPKVILDPPVLYNTVKEGSFVSLTCGFDRCPLSESSFVWYREEQPIRNTTSNKLQFNVSSKHSGNYYCATHENSNIKSKAFKLNVKYLPRNTSVSVSPPGEIVPGSPVTLTCSSNANPPVSSYTWFKTSRNHVVKSGPEQSLIFENISLHDSGEYYCESINEIGRSVSLVVPLIVNCKYCLSGWNGQPSHVIDDESYITWIL